MGLDVQRLRQLLCRDIGIVREVATVDVVETEMLQKQRVALCVEIIKNADCIAGAVVSNRTMIVNGKAIPLERKIIDDLLASVKKRFIA